MTRKGNYEILAVLASWKKIATFYRQQTTDIQNSYKADLDIRNRNLGLCQQIESSYTAESTIKNTTNDHQHPMVCVKLNPTRRLKDPIRPRSYIRKVRKTSPKIRSTPQPSTSPATGNWGTKPTKADPAHGPNIR